MIQIRFHLMIYFFPFYFFNFDSYFSRTKISNSPTNISKIKNFYTNFQNFNFVRETELQILYIKVSILDRKILKLCPRITF